jgi:hypothetical protein
MISWWDDDLDLWQGFAGAAQPERAHADEVVSRRRTLIITSLKASLVISLDAARTRK